MTAIATKPRKTGKQTKYYAAPGARFKTSKAQEYGVELAKLTETHGMITAEIVLDEASHKRSILHDEFTWDDTAAARQYRLREARHLISHISVRLTHVGPKAPRNITVTLQRALHFVTDEDGNKGFVPVQVMKRTANYRNQICKEIATELERLADKLAIFGALTKYAVTLRKAADDLRGE